MSERQDEPGVDLGSYFSVLRRKWWIIALTALLGLGAAAAYLSLVPRTASATATVSLNFITSDPFDVARSTSDLIDPEGEVQVANSFLVAERAVEALGGDQTPQSVREATEATGVADTAIVRITATADSPADARAIADASADAYLSYRSELAQLRIERSVGQSSERLELLRVELREVNERLSNLEGGSEAAVQAESDRALINLEVDALASQLATARGIDTNGGTVLNPASEAPIEFQPPRLLILLTGVVAGLGFGVLLAFLVQALRPRVATAADLRHSGAGEPLGFVARQNIQIPPVGEGLSAYREIRERLLAGGLVASQHGLLAVLSTYRGEVSRGIAVSLAYVLAQSGMRVEYVVLHADDHDVQAMRSALNLGEGEPVGGGTRFLNQDLPTFSMYVPHDDEGDEPLSAAVRHEIQARRENTLLVTSVPEQFGEDTRLAACRLADATVIVAAKEASPTPAVRRAAAATSQQGSQVLGTILVDKRRSLRLDGNPQARSHRH